MLVGSGQSADVSPLGVGLALGSGLGYAAYTVAAKRLLDEGHSPEAVMARTFGAGALILLPILPVTGFAAFTGAPALATSLYLGAIPTALAYVLFARGLQRLPTAEVATLTLAEPLTAAALGTIALGEQLSAGAAVGAAMVLGGLAALAIKPRLRRPAPVPRASCRIPRMSTPPRPLELTSTVDALAAALRPRILEGELAGGARLREQELSDDYGVARHTLRAALRALAAEGLVQDRAEPRRARRLARHRGAARHRRPAHRARGRGRAPGARARRGAAAGRGARARRAPRRDLPPQAPAVERGGRRPRRPPQLRSSRRPAARGSWPHTTRCPARCGS